MSQISLMIDGQKASVFAAKQRLVDSLTEKKAAAEKKNRDAQSAYNSAKGAASTGQADWGPVGMAHVLAMQSAQDLDKISLDLSNATNDFNTAKRVFDEECEKAAAQQVK